MTPANCFGEFILPNNKA